MDYPIPCAADEDQTPADDRLIIPVVATSALATPTQTSFTPITPMQAYSEQATLTQATPTMATPTPVTPTQITPTSVKPTHTTPNTTPAMHNDVSFLWCHHHWLIYC